MKRQLLCQLLVTAALFRPAAAQYNITNPYAGNISTGLSSSYINVSGNGSIVGGTQELGGNFSHFTLYKANSITGGTQILKGTASTFDITTSNAITGGDQYLYDSASITVDHTNGASGGAFYLFGNAPKIYVAAPEAITNKIIGFHSFNALLSFNGAYHITLGKIYSAPGFTGQILGAPGGAGLTTKFDSETATYAGSITGALYLIKDGTGTLVLTNTNNTFAGSTTVKGGLIEFNHAKNFGETTNQINLDGGGLRWASGNTLDLSGRLNLGAAGGTFDTNGNTVTLATALSGTGALTKTGTGFLRFTSSNTHSGDTTVDGGVIALAGPASSRGQLGGLVGSKITINSGNINLETDNALVGTNPHADILLTINTGGLLSTENNVTILPKVVLDGGYIETASGGNFVTGNYTFTDGLSTAGTGKTSYIMGGAVVIPTAVNVGTGDTLRIGSAIIGNNNLVKQGAGTMVLTGSSSFTGTTIISGGLVEFSNNTNFGNAANKIAVNSGGLRWATGNTADISNRLNPLGLAGGTFDTNGNNVTLASVISGSGALTKNGSGTLRLTGSNTYAGGTVVTSGSLTVAQNNALGTGSVRVQGGTLDVEDAKAFSNDVVLAGGTYRRTVTGSLAGKVNASSDLEGGIDTAARIRAGSVGTTSTLVTSFSLVSAATNDTIRKTDVYHFEGTGTNTFVLELRSASLTEGMLGWLDNGEWVLAIDGNSGNTATTAMQDFEGSYDAFLLAFSGFTLSQTLGAYGFDAETHAAWAVLNHNSDFAVIPEPGTVTLLVLGAVTLMARLRRS